MIGFFDTEWRRGKGSGENRRRIGRGLNGVKHCWELEKQQNDRQMEGNDKRSPKIDVRSGDVG
jgi:hypothetical protein